MAAWLLATAAIPLRMRLAWAMAKRDVPWLGIRLVGLFRACHSPAPGTSSTSGVMATPLARTSRNPRGSPDGHALLGGEPQGVGLGDAEGGVEVVDVADDLVAAELRRRVRVGGQPLQDERIARLGLPDRRPAEEQPLQAGEAVDRGVRLAAGDPPGLDRDAEATEVADVLADRQLPVDEMAGGLQGGEGVV